MVRFLRRFPGGTATRRSIGGIVAGRYDLFTTLGMELGDSALYPHIGQVEPLLPNPDSLF